MQAEPGHAETAGPTAPTGLLPLHLSLRRRRVVVVGGGPVAARKVCACVAAHAQVLVVAPHGCKQIVAAADAGAITWLRREYRAGDLDGCWLAFTATGDRTTDEAVQLDAEAQRIFCVRADDASTGGARTPAVVRRDGLLISVGSTDAADPRRCVAVRNAIAQVIDSGSLPLRRYRSAGRSSGGPARAG